MQCRFPFCVGALLAMVAVWPAAWGFAHAAIGDEVGDVEMPTLEGGRHHLLTNLTANVFIFFKPGQEHSRAAMKQLSAIQKEMADKPVHWVAIASDRIPKADVEAEIKESGISMSVVIDVGDALYGRLGVALEPVTGITDQDHKLVAYEPFTRINYDGTIRARLRHLLKEINDDELQAALRPPSAVMSDDKTKSRRDVKLGRRLYDDKKYKEARRAFERALALDPDNAEAAEGKKACEGKENQP
jgi:tetratricopeptide (TPR) repeat protein